MFLEEVDAYYHLRRIELALANNLVIPGADTYVNHPFGAKIDWAPGFDLLFALIYHVLSKATTTPLSPAAVGAVGVAVLGSVTAAALAILVSRWGLWAGLAAGLIVAWSPAAVAYSRIGRLDHHAIEPLWLVVLCAAYAWSRQRPSHGRAVALGAVMALGTLFWPGVAFYAAALALAFALDGWLTAPYSARHGAVAYSVAAALAAVLALSSPWAGAVVYYGLSWFQPLVFAAVAIGFGGVALLERRGVEAHRAWALCAVVLGALGASVLVLGGGSVGRGIAFLFHTDVVSTTVLESRSLIELGFGYALRWLTPVGVLLPILWATAVALAVRQRRPDPLLTAALALGALAMPLALLQMRFGPHAAVVSALLASWLIARVGRVRAQAAFVAVLAAVLAWGVRPATLPDSMVHPYLLAGFDALLWLRHRAPGTSHFRQPWRTPEYGVAAEWVWGHWITQIGQKPSIASPLGQTPRNIQGVAEVARLFLAESEAEAGATMERLGIRYLLLSSIPVTVSELAVQAGREPSRYATTNADGSRSFRQPFFETYHSRLYLGGGAGEAGTAPVSHVRLVFESKVQLDFMGRRPAVRIFEVVPGARLHGTCRSEFVEVRAELERSSLVYTARDVPDRDGAFVVRMPYSSQGTEASIPARIRLTCGAAQVEVTVSDRDVLDGRAVPVTVPGDAPPPAIP